MTLQNISNTTEFTLRYEGNFKYLDVFPFVAFLGGLCKAIKECAFTLHPEHDLLIAVKETQTGSFYVNLAFLGLAGHNFFSSVNIVDMTKNTLEFFVAYLELLKHLKGSPPKDTIEKKDGIEVINQHGEASIVNQTVFNIYTNNLTIRQDVQKGFSAIESSYQIDKLSIESTGKRLFTAERKDFPFLSKTVIKETEKERIELTTAIIHLIKPSFEKGLKWMVAYQHNKINVEILDHDFMEKVQQGEIKFGKGDALEVEMEIKQAFDEAIGIFMNKRFRVLKVLKILRAPVQKDLRFYMRDDQDVSK